MTAVRQPVSKGIPAVVAVFRFFGKGSMASKQVHRGNLEQIPPSTLIADIFRGKFTGVLALEREGCTKSLFIRGGQVIFADSSEMHDRLGQVLVRGNRITEEKITEALETQKKSSDQGKQLLGTILVKEGFIEPLDLVWAVKTQVEEIFCDCFRWTSGGFSFTEEENPDSWEIITLDLPMHDLLRSAADRVEDPLNLAGLLGDFGQRVTVPENWMGLVEKYRLQALEFDLLGRVQAGADNLAALVLSAPYPAADTGRAILLLKSLGVIRLNLSS